MKTWLNVINLILLVIILLILLGYLAASSSIVPSDQILGFMKDSKAEAALVIDRAGRVSSINANGEQLTQCSVGPEGKYPQCKGLGIGGTVLTSEMYNILTVRGSGCVTLIGADGKNKEWCWE